MTIAISLKVNDGIILAADSASTMIEQGKNGLNNVSYVYNNANKVFNLKKGLPIGAITWGSGSIGQASISTLVKDFRTSLNFPKKKYEIRDIAKKFKKFIYDEHYMIEFKNWKEKPPLGFVIAGYSSNSSLAEEWKIDMNTDGCKGPYSVRNKDEVGINCNGEPEAIQRLYAGYSSYLPYILNEAKIDKNKIDEIIRSCSKLMAPMITPAMPIQDAIDLTKFFIETTIKFSRFTPGPQTVGGPIEIAAITKHEKFKWIDRKHYFDYSINSKGV
jgi:hypothetical protein